MVESGSENDTIVGWHDWVWDLDSSRLTSWQAASEPNSDPGVWELNARHVALCYQGGGHEVPQFDCDCGVVIYTSPTWDVNWEEVSSPQVVRGLVAGGGERLAGPGVMRTTWGRLLAIGCYHRINGCACAEAARAYGVEFYPRPHQQLVARAKEEGMLGVDSQSLWQSYQLVMPSLQRTISLEYASEPKADAPLCRAEVEIAAAAETHSSDSAALKAQPLLSQGWWDAYTTYLLGILVPYRQTEIVSDFLVHSLANYGVGGEGVTAGELEPMVYLLTLTALAGQFSRQAGSLFEWLRSCWRAGVAPAVRL